MYDAAISFRLLRGYTGTAGQRLEWNQATIKQAEE
jgi:hypothetical protein